KVAPVMQQAIVAVEDGRFYEHRGVDMRGLLRAFAGNASGDSGVVQGGSTLTQQNVKNVFVNSAATPEEAAAARARSITRKIKEMRYALALEKSLTKDQILERYLNIAYFGSGAYGVEAAAHHYFDKSAKDLTLPEAATLAGIVQQPTAFDPTRHPQRSLERRDVVLTRMAEVGYATPQAVAAAKALPMGLRVPKNSGNGCDTSAAPFFCDYVVKILLTDPTFGPSREERVRLLLRGGLTITTTLDRKAQAAAQRALAKHVKPTDKVASAVVSVQPGTGQVKAMAVSRGFGDGKGQIKFNPATDRAYGGSSGFQAGSTFKAFVATAALEKGIPFDYRIYSPYQKSIGDIQSCRGPLTESWSPRNENHAENGSFTLRTGLALSVNTFFAQLEQKVGVCRPVTLATQMGLRRADGQPLQQIKAFTLGVDEVSPLGMAQAYATFAARGQHCSPIAITQVVDPSGRNLPVPQSDCQQVMDQKIADGVTALLRGVIDGNIRGRTGAHLSLGRPAAGKTGTTDSRISVWFIGYTPDLATAVWAGNPSPPPGGYPLVDRTIGGTFYHNVCGGCLPGPIWKDTMLGALAGVPVSDFTPPPSDVIGGSTIRVPSVTGMSVSQATSVLQAAGLQVDVSGQQVPSINAPQGTVASTSPGEGSAVFPGQKVTIYVSSGQPPVQAPPPPPTSPPGQPNCKHPNKPGCPTTPPPG
ncbi:MAG TPA: transglycosylase domain-containing protein, partial [Candidatus Eisenbacteria bacterium]|nr:transglycosylase domain-containing protein [Candidatus Eisenbacteria bacterium]